MKLIDKIIWGCVLMCAFGTGLLLRPWVDTKLPFPAVMKFEVPAARLLLSHRQGVCQGKGLEARHEPKNGVGGQISGCWIPLPQVGYVQVSFFDGEVGQVPMDMFEVLDKTP